jgi:hypothetical protein
VSDRTTRRWRERIEEEGYSGLTDRRKGKPSGRPVALAVVEEVLRLYQGTYYDLNMRHFREKLKTEHGNRIELHVGTKGAAGGRVGRQRQEARQASATQRAAAHDRDAIAHRWKQEHQWFGDQRWYDLIVILDDATSKIYYAQLVEEESTRTVMARLWEVIETEGLFCSLYSDRGSR